MTGLHDIAVAILTAVATAFSVHALPDPADPAWRVERAWEPHGPGAVLRATSTAIPVACRADPAARVQFPPVLFGAQEIRVDGRLVVRFGDPSFARARSAYGAPSLACAEIAEARELDWSAFSSTRVFARVTFSPRLTHSPPFDVFLTEMLPVMVAGSLFGGALFCFMVFRGVAPDALRLSLVIACLGFGVYCLALVAGVVGLPVSVLAAQRIGAAAILAAGLAIANLLRFERLLSPAQFVTYVGFATIGIGLETVATSGDVAHLGTLITMPFACAILAIAFVDLARRIAARGRSLGTILEMAALTLSVTVLAHDFLVTRGLIAGSHLGPIGMLGAVMCFAMAVHARIVDAFREREFLRDHLEAEVERQAGEAHRRAAELSQALDDLGRAQAQLVHSEKMASLGILVAGVAHELNNPVSFIVNSAEPLGELVQEADAAAAAGDLTAARATIKRIARIVDIVRRGAERTANIVRDLRNFSRRGTGEARIVDVHEGIEVTLRLLRPRWADRIEIVREFGPPLRVRASDADLNQVWMNLLANACDAIAGTGHIWIRTAIDGGHVVVAVRDDGGGIAPADAPRVFDPFFSTKAPGKGTGLGLAVSHGIVTRLGGDIVVETAPGVGTTMTVRLPVALLAPADAAPATKPARQQRARTYS